MTVTAVVVGIGLSSRAIAPEVRRLVERTLEPHGLTLDDVTAIATRSSLAGDPRLRLGPAIVGHHDHDLIAASAPCDRAVGLPARVAETAALLSASAHGEPRLLGPAARSPLATAAVAVALQGRDGSPPSDRGRPT